MDGGNTSSSRNRPGTATVRGSRRSPASRSSTVVSVLSDSRAATTQPAAPAPTTM